MAFDYLTSNTANAAGLVVDRRRSFNRSLAGTNSAANADCNRRIVLQIIRNIAGITRTEIANLTGLSSPTVSSITASLFAQKLILGTSPRTGQRGQPAERMWINPEGALAIGVAPSRDDISLVSLDLSGAIRSRFTFPRESVHRDDPRAVLRRGIDKIVADAAFSPQRILGIGIAVPDEAAGVSSSPHSADVQFSKQADIIQLLAEITPWPLYIDNDIAAAAVGEANFGDTCHGTSFFYIFVGDELGSAIIIDGVPYRGCEGRSGAIGALSLGFASAFGSKLHDVLSLSQFRGEGAQELAFGAPQARATRSEERGGAIENWVEEAALELMPALIAVICLINPATIFIGGSLPATVIDPLVVRVQNKLNASASDIPVCGAIRRAAILRDARVIGAASLPFVHRVLPSNTTLVSPEAQLGGRRRFDARSRWRRGLTQF